jgi:hypothetical protein
MTPERAYDPQFIIALMRGETPPGIEPGSADDIELRGMAADAFAVADAAPPMSAGQIASVAAKLVRRHRS